MISDRYAPVTYALFRIVFGFLFLCFGLQKVAGMFGAQAVPLTAWPQGYAGIIETVAGLLIMLGLFTKPAVADYPAYLKTACAGDPNGSCTTIHYKSATRAHIESLGYDIVANFGDQFSDLKGGYADRTFKLPNPNYYLP